MCRADFLYIGDPHQNPLEFSRGFLVFLGIILMNYFENVNVISYFHRLRDLRTLNGEQWYNICVPHMQFIFNDDSRYTLAAYLLFSFGDI